MAYEYRGALFTSEHDTTDPRRMCIWIQMRPYGSKHWMGSVECTGIMWAKFIRQHHLYPFVFTDEAIIDSMKILGLYSTRFEPSTVQQMYRPSVDRTEDFMLHWCQAASVTHQEEVLQKRATPWPKSGVVTITINHSFIGDHTDQIYIELKIQFNPTPTLIGVSRR